MLSVSSNMALHSLLHCLPLKKPPCECNRKGGKPNLGDASEEVRHNQDDERGVYKLAHSQLQHKRSTLVGLGVVFLLVGGSWGVQANQKRHTGTQRITLRFPLQTYISKRKKTKRNAVGQEKIFSSLAHQT